MQVDVDPSNIIEGKRRRAKVDYSVRPPSLPSSFLFLPGLLADLSYRCRAPKPSKKSQISQMKMKMTRTRMLRLFLLGTTMRRKSRRRRTTMRSKLWGHLTKRIQEGHREKGK